MCIEGLVYRLSHDCHFDIDRDYKLTLYTCINPGKTLKRKVSGALSS